MEVTLIHRDNRQESMQVESCQDLYQQLVDRCDIDAICGGCSSCATCHVYVDPASSDKLIAADETERDVLDGLLHKQAGSRLLCQLQTIGDADELTLTLSPGE